MTLRPEDQEFKASLGYIVRFCLSKQIAIETVGWRIEMMMLALSMNDSPATHKPSTVASHQKECQVLQTVLQTSFKQTCVGGVSWRPSLIIAHLLCKFVQLFNL